MRVSTPDLQRLATAVHQRRLQLNLSIRNAATAGGGLSKDTWTRVENADPVRHSTYGRVEHALGWTTGSCRLIMDGGEPTVDGVQVGFTPVPPDELEGRIRRAVQDAMVASTDLNASAIRDVNNRAIEALREQGILPADS